MDKERTQRRIVAIDLRSRKFGFAVLEGPRTLLEWGAKCYREPLSDIPPMMLKGIDPLLTSFSPEAIVVRQFANRSSSGRSRHSLMLNAVEQEARRRSMKFVIIGREEIAQCFGTRAGATKHDVACRIALHFPELTWRLPPTRKSWMKEHYTMTIFDAVSAGLTYLARFSDVFPNTTREPEARAG